MEYSKVEAKKFHFFTFERDIFLFESYKLPLIFVRLLILRFSLFINLVQFCSKISILQELVNGLVNSL